MERPRLEYRLGDFVRIKLGPFAQFKGQMEEINQSKSLLKENLSRLALRGKYGNRIGTTT